MATQQYRIKKDVTPWGGRVLHGADTPDAQGQVSGYIHTTYKSYGPYVYRMEELEPMKPKAAR